MKKIYLLCLLLIILTQQAMGQEVSINYQPGIGFYSMKDLKGFQEQRLNMLDVDAGIDHDYPGFFNHQLQFINKFSKSELGLVYRRQSSGSRISYKDYSGEITLDTKINAHGVGIYFAVPLLEKSNNVLLFFGQGFVVFSDLNMRDHISIYNYKSDTETLDLYSRGYLFEPGMRFTRMIRQLKLGAEMGIDLNLYNEDFHLKGKKESKAQDFNGQFFRPNWSGVRFALVLGFVFK